MLKWEGWANVQLSSSDVDAWSGPGPDNRSLSKELRVRRTLVSFTTHSS